MVVTIAVIAGAWVQRHHGKWQSRLMGVALLVSMLGIFMAATRLNALMLFALVLTTIFTGRLPGAYRFRWLILLVLLGYLVGGSERLQRFRTLQDPDFLSERLVGSVNLSFLELVRQYPLGNGLGGGGTSVPYFLQDRIRNTVYMENEYARILLELGLPGLLMWTLFLVWVFTRGRIKKQDMFYFGRRLSYVACACAFGTGLLGTGVFTAVPMTAIVLLLIGWFVVPEVPFAPIAEARAPGAVASPAVNYGRTG
jgi:fatty acid desaturase